ncbi:FAD-dependent oxidoreductase [Cellulosimicrobium funkei]|uniref:FAD-dependent oxidoreductase n=1 Tax=Cellulosimicrobium funkei TaxID=264251 RepID=UPI003756B5FB
MTPPRSTARRTTDRDVDVLVVGGGPVGLAAALHARRAGHDVLVVDRRAGVIDKACGEGLLPGALSKAAGH